MLHKYAYIDIRTKPLCTYVYFSGGFLSVDTKVLILKSFISSQPKFYLCAKALLQVMYGKYSVRGGKYSTR